MQLEPWRAARSCASLDRPFRLSHVPQRDTLTFPHLTAVTPSAYRPQPLVHRTRSDAQYATARITPRGRASAQRRSRRPGPQKFIGRGAPKNKSVLQVRTASSQPHARQCVLETSHRRSRPTVTCYAPNLLPTTSTYLRYECVSEPGNSTTVQATQWRTMRLQHRPRRCRRPATQSLTSAVMAS